MSGAVPLPEEVLAAIVAAYEHVTESSLFVSAEEVN
jgi:hypothetical protein